MSDRQGDDLPDFAQLNDRLIARPPSSPMLVIRTNLDKEEIHMTDRDQNEKPDMGYHGSNMHGYSLTPKEGKLDQPTATSAKDEADQEKESFR